MAQLRLFSMTALLTLVIWATADSLVSEVAFVDLTLRPVSTHPDMLVQIDQAAGRFSLQVSGSRREVERVRSKGPLVLNLPVAEQPSGTAIVPLDRNEVRRELAERWTEFERLSVVAVRPGIVPVNIDRFVSREIQLIVERGSFAFDVEPKLQRSTVTARVRESVLSSLPQGQPPQYNLTHELERALAEQPVGKNVTIAIPLDPRRFGVEAEFNPSVVEVTAVVKAERQTEQIPTVPVLLAMNFSNLGRPLQVAARDGTPLSLLTQTIRVRGLPVEVQKLVRGETRAYGIIHFKEDDLNQLNTVKPMTPEFHLPTGVELAHDPEPVELQLIPASTPSPAQSNPKPPM